MANEGVKDPVDNGRRRFLTASTVVVGAVGAGFAAIPFIKSWNPSARAKLAGAPVIADISALEEGQRLVFEWRGQPIWIVKRSKALLEILPTLDGRLRDPESENADQQPAYARNELRSIKPEISVLVGLCTHLGCSPEMKAEIKPEPFDPEWKAAISAPATSRSSTWPDACSRAFPRRSTCWCRRTITKTTPRSSSASIRRSRHARERHKPWPISSPARPTT